MSVSSTATPHRPAMAAAGSKDGVAVVKHRFSASPGVIF
jgi:hypothetical protein